MPKRTERPSRPPPRPTLTLATLLEHLGQGAVSEIAIVETGHGRFELHVALPWRDSRSVLVGVKGAPRQYRSLDTLVAFLRTAALGATPLRLELQR